MLSLRSAIRLALANVFVAGLASCSDPLGPDIDRQSTPFYYHQNQKIYLRVDPRRLTVVPEAQGDTGQIRAVLAQRRIVPDSMRPLWVENHWFVFLPSGTSAARAEEGARWLRLQPGARFASVVYRVRGGDCPLFLVNRLSVQFRAGVDEAQIDALNTELGVRNEQITTWGPRLYEYPQELEFTPLELAAHYHRQRIVEWAEADAINGCLRNDG